MFPNGLVVPERGPMISRVPLGLHFAHMLPDHVCETLNPHLDDRVVVDEYAGARRLESYSLKPLPYILITNP